MFPVIFALSFSCENKRKVSERKDSAVIIDSYMEDVANISLEVDVEGKEEWTEGKIFEDARSFGSLLRDRNFKELSLLVHPGKGLLFSPYGYVNTVTARVYTSDQMRNFGLDSLKKF